jgi:hypothetical protein
MVFMNTITQRFFISKMHKVKNNTQGTPVTNTSAPAQAPPQEATQKSKITKKNVAKSMWKGAKKTGKVLSAIVEVTEA